MVLPNTIIIGAQKAGTTSLYDWLSQHPDVYGEKSMKDFPFFVNNEFYSKGLEWFQKSFSEYKNEKIILHGHVNYIYFSELASQRIHEDLGQNTKIIVILRNPIDRAYSAFWHQKKVGYEHIDTFETALSAERERLHSTNFRTLAELTYIDHGYYSKQLPDYFNMFNKDNIKIILFEDLVKNKSLVVKSIFNFLEIDDCFVPQFTKKNESGIPRIKFIQKILSTRFLPKVLVDFIPVNLRIQIKKTLKNLNTTKKKYFPMMEETKLYLNKIYSNELTSLEKLLNVKLKNWR